MLPICLPRPEPLTEGVLLRRYKRFFCDVELADGSSVTAHCVNTGAMEGLVRPGIRVWISRAANPKRKLAWTWELAEVDGRIYGVNTAVPNRLVGQLLRQGQLDWLHGFSELHPEQCYPGCRRRADFLLRGEGREHWLEVKNCHLIYPDRRGYFPDCVSQRAAAHMQELQGLLGRPGVSAEVLFVLQVAGGRGIRPSDVHDRTFAAAARAAAAAGVRFSALGVSQTPDSTVIEARLPVELEPYPTGEVEVWKAAASLRKA